MSTCNQVVGLFVQAACDRQMCSGQGVDTGESGDGALVDYDQSEVFGPKNAFASVRVYAVDDRPI